MSKYSFEMFHDYYRGLSTRELEKKYACSIISITAYCKRVMAHLMNNGDSVVGGNIENIKKEVDSIIIINVER